MASRIKHYVSIAYHVDSDYDEGGIGGSSDDDDVRTDGWVLGYN